LNHQKQLAMKQNQNSCYCDNQHLVVAEDVCDLCYGVVSPSTEPEMRHLDCLGSWMDGMMQGGAA
jgi:hypothetical protein